MRVRIQKKKRCCGVASAFSIIYILVKPAKPVLSPVTLGTKACYRPMDSKTLGTKLCAWANLRVGIRDSSNVPQGTCCTSSSCSRLGVSKLRRRRRRRRRWRRIGGTCQLRLRALPI